MREAGKGDDQRPTDHKKFSSGYDLIWGKKDDKTTDRAVSTVQESKDHDHASKSNDDPS
jgi:hypothetical protein